MCSTSFQDGLGLRIAAFLGADAETEQPWLATEYVEGADLGSHVKRHGPLPTPLAAEPGAVIAEALGPVHQQDLLLRVLRERADGVRSPAEGLARGVVLGTDLPRPRWNPRLVLDGGVLAVPDAYWQADGLMLEVDSKEHHWAVADGERTMARHNRLAALGFRVLHVSPQQLRERPGEVIRAIRAALRTGPHGPVDRVRLRS